MTEQEYLKTLVSHSAKLVSLDGKPYAVEEKRITFLSYWAGDVFSAQVMRLLHPWPSTYTCEKTRTPTAKMTVAQRELYEQVQAVAMVA